MTPVDAALFTLPANVEDVPELRRRIAHAGLDLRVTGNGADVTIALPNGEPVPLYPIGLALARVGIGDRGGRWHITPKPRYVARAEEGEPRAPVDGV